MYNNNIHNVVFDAITTDTVFLSWINAKGKPL